jgi:hypothetical protein
MASSLVISRLSINIVAKLYPSSEIKSHNLQVISVKLWAMCNATVAQITLTLPQIFTSDLWADRQLLRIVDRKLTG